MKFRHLLVLFTTVLTFSNSPFFAQINSALFTDVLAQDSLQGFDMNQANAIAQSEGLTGSDFANAIKLYKRNFVINKYNLHPKANTNQPFQTNWFGKYGPASTAVAPCSNEGFESGSLTAWSASAGINSNSQQYPSTPTQISAGSQVTVLSTPITDPFVGTIGASPFTGSNVVRINNSSTGAVVVKLTQTFSVTPTNYLYEFAYWAVMEDAGAQGLPHTCQETPYMQVKFRDSNGNLQTCPNFSIIAPASGSGACPGIGPLTWSTVALPTRTIQTSTGWQKFSVDLSTYITSPFSEITVEIIVGDCSLGGHFGYAYFDSNCNSMNLTVNNNPISLLSPTVFPQVICGGTATMVAPAGLGPFVWNGPSGSGVSSNTNQTVSSTVPGNYTLAMSPVGICNPPITKVINLSFVPPTTVTATPANLCATGTATSSTLSAAGATSYTWSPGGSTLSTIVVTPTITTIYTVTARTGTCVGIFTVQVSVNPDPSVNILSSNTSVCPGQSATLTAFGASTYVWNPGTLTGSLVSVSPTIQTTYTVIGTSTAGCTGSAVTTISISAAPPVSIFPATVAPICIGGAVNLIGVGAPSFTWLPGNVTGIFQTFSPTVTTTYTAIGAASSCTNSATITVTVDPGPSMTLTATPPLACPGASVTLSGTAPTAVGSFTWDPGATTGSSIVVTATNSGGYSVTARNALGCSATYTINPNYSPLPSLTISPSSPSVCFGSSITLTASGGNTYTWQPGNLNGTSISVSPTTNTTYTLTGANGAGCTSQTTTVVNVISLPVISSTANPASFCVGNCFTFNNSGAVTYTASPGTLCPLNNTTYTVVGTGASGCVSNPVLVSVTVNPSPALTVSASPTPICAGSSSTLTANGASTYVWSTGGTGANIVVNPTVTTVYSVTGTSASGCTTVATFTLNVLPLPSISITPASASVCVGSSVSLNASGAAFFTWQPGSLSGANVNVAPVATTVYTVTGSNGGCTGQNTVQVTVLSIPVITASFNPASICAGNCATLNPSGASTYTVSGGSTVVCPTVTTVYTVTGSNGFCNSAPVTATLNVNPLPVLTVSANPSSICVGASATLSANGASSYVWSTGGTGTSVVVSPSVTTVYSVTGTSASGCTAVASVTVNVLPLPSVSVSPASPSICIGSSVNLTASGASSYTWQPGSLAGAAVNVSPGATTIYTVTGSNGACTGQTTVQVTVLPVPVITASFNPTSICAGNCATLNPSGGSSYTISGGSTVVCPTVTTVYTVTGSNGFCTSAPITVTLTVNNGPVINASASPASICAGQSSTLSAIGATPVTWQPGSLAGNNVVVSPSSTTIYSVTGSNGFGCSTTQTVQLTVTPLPVVTASASPSSICAGSSATLSATGASGLYVWQPGSLTGSSVFVFPTSNTTYTVTGFNGACSATAAVSVSVIAAPTVSLSASSTSVCAGGSVTLTASGLTNYQWADGPTSPVRTVTPGVTTTYSVFGNAGGCASTNTAAVTIVVSPLPAVSATASPNNLCAGGSSTLSASGTAASYLWSPGAIPGANITVTPSSNTTYTVTGTSAAGCSDTASVLVLVNPIPTLAVSAAPSTICAGGSAFLSAIGSAANYSWQPGGLTGANVVVSPSITTNYTVTGYNASGCNTQSTVLVTVSPNPNITISASTTSLCAPGCATLTAFGASNYTWSTGAFTNPIVVCPSTSTTYIVAGSIGSCFGAATINITVGPPAAISVSASPSSICAGAASTLSAFGGTSYIWQPGSLTGANVVVSPSVTTVYTVTGLNSSGCQGTAAVVVTVNPAPAITASANPSSVCAGQSATLQAGGGTSYNWAPSGGSGSAVVVTPAGTTIYTVTGSNGLCSNTQTVQVSVNSLPVVNASANPSVLCGGSGITTTLSASGGTSYAWSPGSGSGSVVVVIPVVTTQYTVTATAANGCTNSATALVTVNTSPSPSITASSNTICAGQSATLTASGAGSYSWSTGSTANPIVVSPSVTTVYSVIGTNGSCQGTATRTIFVAPLPPLSIIASTTTPCVGFTVALAVVGPPTHTWFPGGSVGSPFVVTPSVNTVYTVITTGGPLACTNSQTIAINPIPLPVIGATANPSGVCPGGSSTLSASGGLTYTWVPGFTPGNPIVVTPSVTTTYTVGGIAASGCPNFTTVTVNVGNAPVVVINSSAGSVCPGGSATLTATGANNYTWLPSGQTGVSLVVNPTSATTYTLLGDNGACTGSTTAVINVFNLPVITASASNPTLCAGSTVTLSANGALTYVWNPTGQGGQTITDSPVASTVYTVTGQDINGCVGEGTVSVFVNPLPTISTAATTSVFCGANSNSVLITAIGANSYTWFPGNQVTVTIVDTPTITTTYTVYGTDSNGCIGMGLNTVSVVPVPTIVISPVNPSICIGTSATLTATGANNYTWLPSNTTSSVTIESPITQTTYTVIGSNGGFCVGTETVTVFVNPLPTHVGAASSGTVTCSSPTVQLFGTSSATNVSYFWNGPTGYTAAVQNPTPSGVWGDFTVTVTDNVTGCFAQATVNVPTDNSIPSVTASTSGSITCAVSIVTLNAANTTTNAGYSWVGPGGFTSTVQTPTVSVAGDYTITVTDLSSTCTGTSVVTVGTRTSVIITATIVPSTCQGTVSANNGMILVSGFEALDKYDLVSGTSYTGSATYTSAALIPVGGTITSNLANPTSTVAYTIRFFDANGCQKDTTLILEPVDCSIKTLGVAKAVSAPKVNSDGSYNVTYTVVVKNYSNDPLYNVTVADNLAATFPSPSTFTVYTDSTKTGSSSALSVNAGFDGSTQTNLVALGNTLTANASDTVYFTVRVKPSAFFVPYFNTAYGEAQNITNFILRDSSAVGLNPDPDGDGLPTNNNLATGVTFIPVEFFGITKTGEIVKSDNNSFNVSYTVTIHNLGNDTLKNVALNDSIFGKTIKDPATYSMRTAPISSDLNLVANSSFNGKTDIRLILPEQSKLPPKTISSIRFVINVIPGTVTSITNSAYGSANARISETDVKTVSDTSNAGSNPDSNNNGVWNEWVDNTPTVLEIPNTSTLFIPEGFSPDGDNINDVFKIVGLPTDGENSLTVFNRWGNKVYENSNYDNSWDGTPNAGVTLGKNKLPQGTYYYILDMKGSGKKPITGFVVLQY